MAKEARKNETFASVLDIPSTEVERPKPIPAGHYVFLVVGQPEFGKSAKKQTEQLEYTCKPIAVFAPEEGEPDVDMDALQEMGGLGERTMRLTFYLTDNAVYRLHEFLDDLGIPREDEDGTSLNGHQRVMLSPNQQFVGWVKHSNPAEDQKGNVYANIVSTTRLAD